MELVLDEFIGIDTRPGRLGTNVPAFLVARNVDLITGGAIRTRPAMRLKAPVHAESVGLYTRGGYLRAVVPGGHSFQDLAPTDIIYDPIGDVSGGVGTGNLDRVTSVAITNGGSGYATPPTLTFSGGGAAVQATATCTVSGGSIVTVAILTRGSGYTSAPAIGITGGGGAGAILTASISAGAFAYPLGVLAKLVASDTYGVSGLFGPNGLVLVERSDTGQRELHWLTQPPESAAYPVATRVPLPFQAGSSMVKLANHEFIPDQALDGVRFNSAVNGPIDWETVGDAGFLPTANHVSGNNTMVAVSHHRGKLAVLYRDAIQLWHVAEDPNQHEIQQVLSGPGTILPGAIANVLGDLVYLSRGGFRNLQTVTITGESDENEQMGTPIRSLTDAIDGTVPAAALWSQSRSAFLCAIGTTVYVWTYLPVEKRRGWTTWELPTPVQFLVEQDGVLSARGGDTVYEFDDNATLDYNGQPIAAEVESRTFLLNKGRPAELAWLVIRQTQSAAWTMIIDGVARAAHTYPSCPDRPLRIPLSGQGRMVAFRITAAAGWRLDGLRIDVNPLAGA